MRSPRWRWTPAAVGTIAGTLLLLAGITALALWADRQQQVRRVAEALEGTEREVRLDRADELERAIAGSPELVRWIESLPAPGDFKDLLLLDWGGQSQIDLPGYAVRREEIRYHALEPYDSLRERLSEDPPRLDVDLVVEWGNTLGGLHPVRIIGRPTPGNREFVAMFRTLLNSVPGAGDREVCVEVSW